jgi:hypothetical protein
MGSSGMMFGQMVGFGLLGWFVNLLIIGAVVYIAVRLALKHHK